MEVREDVDRRSASTLGGVQLGLAEWMVLAVVDERPAHGFAVAALTARDGELGRVWHVPRPVVYRALGRLEEADLIAKGESESGPGPQRTPYASTASGHTAVLAWLRKPVSHVRDMRSEFLVKLALNGRRGDRPTDLITAQRTLLAGVARALAIERAAGVGFDVVLLTWRESTVAAATTFLERIPESWAKDRRR